jgi:hypothetical protein
LHGGRGDWLTGGIVLTAYALVQLALLSGPHPHDPAKYFDAGIAFPNVDANRWTLRIGLVGPVRAAVALFGPSEVALYAVPFAVGLLLAASVYGTMLLLFGERAIAAAAALVAALNPYVLLNSSFLYPDTAATAVLTAAFLCLVYGATRSDERYGSRAAPAFAVGAGVLFGWAYLIREFSPLLLPAMVVAMVLLRYRTRQIVAVAAATLVTVVVEPIYGLLRYGDPFLHLRSLVVHRPQARVTPTLERRMEPIQEQLDTLLDTVIVFPRLLLSWHAGWVYLLLTAIFVVALARRDTRLWLFAPWFFGFWTLMAIVGVVTLPSGRWLLNITNIRYWYPIFPALVMGAFGGVAILMQTRTKFRGISLMHAVAGGLVALALVPAVTEYRRCAAMDVWLGEPRAPWYELRAWLGTPEATNYTVIRTDANTGRYLPAFTRTAFGTRLWAGAVERLRPRNLPDTPPSLVNQTLVLVNTQRTISARTLSALRRDWAPVFVSDDQIMVALAHRSITSAGEDPAWSHLPPQRTRIADVTGCGLNPYASAQGAATGSELRR